MKLNPAKQKIICALRYLECPEHDSVWLGPFEQLVGGGYALLAATEHGIYERNLQSYNTLVQKRAIYEIEKMFLHVNRRDLSIVRPWLSGFYFNSAIQRLVWAGERLMLTFAWAQCTCGRKKESDINSGRPKWQEILTASLSRLDHIQNDDGLRLVNCRAVREQSIFRDQNGKERGYNRDDSLDRGKILSMLRYSVNNRKHRVYLRSKLRDQESAGKGNKKTWSASGADFQMDLAIEAFDLLCRAYKELKDWNPRPVVEMFRR